jgi:hypothetical protein
MRRIQSFFVLSLLWGCAPKTSAEEDTGFGLSDTDETDADTDTDTDTDSDTDTDTDTDIDDQDGDGFDVYEDCDDLDATVYPNAPELCDGIDNDCDERVDEHLTDGWYADPTRWSSADVSDGSVTFLTLEQAPDGTLWAQGIGFGGGDTDIGLYTVDMEGADLVVPMGEDDTPAVSLAITDDGIIYWARTIQDEGGTSRAAAAFYDPASGESGVTVLDSIADESFATGVVTNGDAVYISGMRSFHEATNHALWRVSSASVVDDGADLYPESMGISALHRTDDGVLYAAAMIDSSGDTHMVVRELSETGTRTVLDYEPGWSEGTWTETTGLAVDADGDIWATAFEVAEDTPVDVWKLFGDLAGESEPALRDSYGDRSTYWATAQDVVAHPTGPLFALGGETSNASPARYLIRAGQGDDFDTVWHQEKTTSSSSEVYLSAGLVDPNGDVWAIGGPSSFAEGETVESVLVHLSCAATEGDNNEGNDEEEEEEEEEDDE